MRVEPIKDLGKIKAIKKQLATEPRNLLLFTLGLNSGLRMGDLLKLRVRSIYSLQIGDKVNLKEQKTGKQNYFIINKEIYKAMNAYFNSLDYIDFDKFLFASRKGDKALRIETASRLVKKWCSDVGLQGNYGAHSLRKTWGYINRNIHKANLDLIQKRFNHSSQSTTLRYIGITDENISDMMLDHNI